LYHLFYYTINKKYYKLKQNQQTLITRNLRLDKKYLRLDKL
jgi:hypothetical protein